MGQSHHSPFCPCLGQAQCPGPAAVAVLVPCAAGVSVLHVAMPSPPMSDPEHAVVSLWPLGSIPSRIWCGNGSLQYHSQVQTYNLFQRPQRLAKVIISAWAAGNLDSRG